MIRENEIISKVLLTIDQFKGNVDQFMSAIGDNEYTPQNTKHFTRSLIWKTCYITKSLNIQTWDTRLSESRVIYHALTKRKDMNIPWWDLESDHIFYQSKELTLTRKQSLKRYPSAKIPRNVKKTQLSTISISNSDDPLSSSSSQLPLSKDNHIIDDLDLLKTIIMDIDRLFPGEKYFNSLTPTSLESKRQLIELLFVWSKCNPQVGYKQGFHEIMGLIYINLYKEAIDVPNDSTISKDDLKILSLYDKHYLPHDLFTLFNRFMVQGGIIGRFYENESVLWKSIESINVNLMKIDQLIHYNLISKLKLESQLWAIRYLRLLLLRELGNNLETTSLLWDKLVSVQKSITSIPDLITFLIIGLLIRVKTELITCDFSECLSLLLHYPIGMEFSKSSPEDFIYHLFKDAVKLYDRKDNDLKLYNYGLHLNEKWNPKLKVVMNFSNSNRNSGESSKSGSPAPSEHPKTEHGPMSKNEKIAFEKYRLEMRLKKKAQLLMRP